MNLIDSVSVNGRHVTIISANCQTFKKKKGAYSDKEWALIQQTKTKLETPEIIKSSTLGGRNCLSRYQLIGGGSITTDCSIKETLTSNNGFSVSKQDEDHFSVSKRGLPGELARLFVLGDVIGFVYLDGEVIMKPVACLKKKESKLVKSLRDESHHVSQTVLKNIEADVNFDMGSLEGNLNKETKLNEQSLDAELQDLTKGLDNELGGLLSDL